MMQKLPIAIKIYRIPLNWTGRHSPQFAIGEGCGVYHAVGLTGSLDPCTVSPRI